MNVAANPVPASRMSVPYVACLARRWCTYHRFRGDDTYQQPPELDAQGKEFVNEPPSFPLRILAREAIVWSAIRSDQAPVRGLIGGFLVFETQLNAQSSWLGSRGLEV